jgi:hypothetical protein
MDSPDASEARLLRLAGAWKAFVTGKYRRQRYYFNHLEFLVQLLVLSLNHFAPITVGRCVTLSLVLVALLTLFVKLRPFTKDLRCVPSRPIAVGPWNHTNGSCSKVDVLSACGVALLCDSGAIREHRAHRGIRCPCVQVQGLRDTGNVAFALLSSSTACHCVARFQAAQASLAALLATEI